MRAVLKLLKKLKQIFFSPSKNSALAIPPSKTLHGGTGFGSFAAARNQGCLKLRQIIKAIPDHCDARTPPLLPRSVTADIRRLWSRPSDNGKDDPWNFVRALRWHGALDAKQYGRKTKDPRRLFASKQAGPAAPGLGSKGSAREAMASSALMERSAIHRAYLAAGGTAMGRNEAPADTFSGIPLRIRPGLFSLSLRSMAAGGKRHNAQQDAHRHLPPGGNAGCRRTR